MCITDSELARRALLLVEKRCQFMAVMCVKSVQRHCSG